MRILAMLAVLVAIAAGQQAYNTVDCALTFRGAWQGTWPGWGSVLDRGSIYPLPPEPPWIVNLPPSPYRGTARDATPEVGIWLHQWTGSLYHPLPAQIWAQVGPPAPGVQVGGAGMWQIDLGAGHLVTDVTFCPCGPWPSGGGHPTSNVLYLPVGPNWAGHVTVQAWVIAPWTASGVALSATGEIWR